MSMEEQIFEQLAVAIGKSCREARKARKLTQEEVANHLQVSTEYYARIERGHALPSTVLLVRMAEFYEITLDELVDGCLAATECKSVQCQHHVEIVDPQARRLAMRLAKASPGVIACVHKITRELMRAFGGT